PAGAAPGWLGAARPARRRGSHHPSREGAQRMRRTARALATICQAVLLLAAPPLALTRLVGRPRLVHLPDPVGPADPQQIQGLITSCAGLLGSLAWATLAVLLLLRAA